jgi:hypothetical protein
MVAGRQRQLAITRREAAHDAPREAAASRNSSNKQACALHSWSKHAVELLGPI